MGEHRAGDGLSAAATSWSFDVRGRAPSEEVRIAGQSGAPEISLSGLGGRTYSTEMPAIDVRHEMTFPFGGTALVSLNHPPASAWQISANLGSVPIATVGYAIAQLPPYVKVHLIGCPECLGPGNAGVTV